jgi:hypothetical protein
MRTTRMREGLTLAVSVHHERSLRGQHLRRYYIPPRECGHFSVQTQQKPMKRRRLGVRERQADIGARGICPTRSPRSSSHQY